MVWANVIRLFDKPFAVKVPRTYRCLKESAMTETPGLIVRVTPGLTVTLPTRTWMHVASQVVSTTMFPDTLHVGSGGAARPTDEEPKKPAKTAEMRNAATRRLRPRGLKRGSFIGTWLRGGTRRPSAGVPGSFHDILDEGRSYHA